MTTQHKCYTLPDIHPVNNKREEKNLLSGHYINAIILLQHTPTTTTTSHSASYNVLPEKTHSYDVVSIVIED